MRGRLIPTYFRLVRVIYQPPQDLNLPPSSADNAPLAAKWISTVCALKDIRSCACIREAIGSPLTSVADTLEYRMRVSSGQE